VLRGNSIGTVYYKTCHKNLFYFNIFASSTTIYSCTLLTRREQGDPRLPIELIGGHAEKDSNDRIDGNKRWSSQKLVLETESIVVPFTERCAIFLN
jgi:hypothetical protein